MKSLKNIFHKKQKQEPKPLRVEDVAPAPMTPEPDDAELEECPPRCRILQAAG